LITVPTAGLGYLLPASYAVTYAHMFLILWKKNFEVVVYL